MRLASPILTLVFSSILASTCLVGEAVAAPPSADKLIERAKAFEDTVTKDNGKVRLRHNLERLAGLWATARAKSKGEDKREAMEGELRAWKLIAKWSGKGADRDKVQALARDLRELPASKELAKGDAKPEAKSDVKGDAKPEAKKGKGAKVAAKVEGGDDEKSGPSTTDELLKVVNDVKKAFPELANTGDGGRDEPEEKRDQESDPEPQHASRELPGDDGILAADDDDPAEASDYEDGDAKSDDAVMLAKDGAIKVAARLKRSTRDASKPRATASVVRIRRIVVDAGHGGKDFGALGKNGLREKDVNLAIALELGRQLEKRLGVKVTYTRSSDDYVSLRKRSQIANASDADLFISIHANAHKKRSISGIETYYLNTTSDRYAERLAQRENEGTEDDGDAPEPSVGMTDETANLPNGALGRDLRLILADLAMRSATVESRRLAGYVQSTVVGKLKRKYDEIEDLGVKHALFFVLLGARMPSILVETGFVTNPTEGGRLADPKYRSEVAGAIAHGVVRFVLEREAIARKLDAKNGEETLASVRR